MSRKRDTPLSKEEIGKMSKDVTPLQELPIQEIPSGTIIDIGGGGEGVIGQIGGSNVTAVDTRQSEIEEAKPKAPQAKWVQADAKNLPFSDESFDNATAFFTGMYMEKQEKEQAFKEVYRVLKPQGEFWIWDAKMEEANGLFIIQLRITLPNGKTIKTAYGVRKKEQSAPSMKATLEEAGFEVERMHAHEYWYFLKAKKRR